MISDKKIFNSYLIECDSIEYAKEQVIEFLKKLSFDPILLESLNHPDVVYLSDVSEEKDKETKQNCVISVNDVRKIVVDDIQIKPILANYKAYIIYDAQSLSETAQNALLKTIEEPPEYALIFLITKNKNSLLDTIKSRCVEYSFSGKKQEINRLQNKEYYDLAIQLITNAHYNTVKDINNFAQYLKKNKNEIKDVLLIMKTFVKDVLLYKEQFDISLVDFKDKEVCFQTLQNGLNYSTLGKMIDKIDEAEQEVLCNVDPSFIITKLLLTIREKGE